MAQSDWVRRKGASDYCSMSLRQWDRLQQEGRGPPPTRVAGSRAPRWSLNQLDAWMEGGMRPPPAPPPQGAGQPPFGRPTPWQ